MNSSVFISYRRAGGLETARNIRDRLVHMDHMDIEVFFDLDSLREGRFDEQILARIAKSQHFILILSEGSMDRCVEEDDWVRKEIRKALELGKNIIPVKTKSFKGFPDYLPPDIEKIRYIQDVPLSDEYYEAFFGRLMERIMSDKTLSSHYQDRPFTPFADWLRNDLGFFFFRVALWACAFYCIACVIYYLAEKDIIGILLPLIGVILIYLSFFPYRIKKKYSSQIREIEKNGGRYRIVSNENGLKGLIKVNLFNISVLLPCKYKEIHRVDSNNFVIKVDGGNEFYNANKEGIVQHQGFKS